MDEILSPGLDVNTFLLFCSFLRPLFGPAAHVIPYPFSVFPSRNSTCPTCDTLALHTVGEISVQPLPATVFTCLFFLSFF